jgi:hypothetical protein
MIRKFAPAAAVLLLAAACASTPMTSSSTTTTTTTVPAATTASAAVPQTASNAPDYILLSAPTSVRQWSAINPAYALHVRGTMTSRGFIPVGGVQGRGKLCADGKDWVSLSDLKIHTASEGATPVAPYVLGCASGSTFSPSSREIVTQ